MDTHSRWTSTPTEQKKEMTSDRTISAIERKLDAKRYAVGAPRTWKRSPITNLRRESQGVEETPDSYSITAGINVLLGHRSFETNKSNTTIRDSRLRMHTGRLLSHLI